MMQERKIRLAIFVVIGLLVGGIILDALSRFTVVNSAIATLVRPINFIVGGAASGARSVRIFLRRKGRCRKKMRHSRRRTTTCVRTMWNSLP